MLFIQSTILRTPKEIKSLKWLTGFRSFLLLWRGSRDGSYPKSFHEFCDGKPNTVTLIKNTLGYVFGAYTAVPWSSPSEWTYKSDSTAFLFSLTNPTNKPLKLNVIKPENAVYHNSDLGPVFGRGYNLRFFSFNSSNYMFFLSYQSPNGLNGEEGGKYVLGGSSNYFKALEIEVFQVI